MEVAVLCRDKIYYIVKMIGNVSDWLSYAGGALKVADSAGSTVGVVRE